MVHNPFLGETFHVSVGSGAFLNERAIKVKEVADLRECVIGTGFPHKRDGIREIMARLERVLPRVRDIRRLGSPALDICWVACGRMQAFYEGKLHPWDVAAAKLIAREAGAKIGYCGSAAEMLPDCLNGENIIVSSPGVFDQLQRVLAEGSE